MPLAGGASWPSFSGLQERVNDQKNVFWFRLADFDPEILGRVRAIKKENRAFVPYFATHHFFGRGNWIWCIPMRAPDGRPLISIGITYRKDIYPYGEVRTMEQFLQAVGREHEVVAELTRSGSVVDTNFYSSYMWECRQRYSPDRWYILGDAGDTVDPLYSVGMALGSVQIRQIEAMIAKAARMLLSRSCPSPLPSQEDSIPCANSLADFHLPCGSLP
jgi:hypothetical protein